MVEETGNEVGVGIRLLANEIEIFSTIAVAREKVGVIVTLTVVGKSHLSPTDQIATTAEILIAVVESVILEDKTFGKETTLRPEVQVGTRWVLSTRHQRLRVTVP